MTTAFRRILPIVLLALAATTVSAGEGSDPPGRFGVGAQYWMALKNLDADNVDQDGISWILSFQSWSGYIGWETALQWYKKGFGGAKDDVLGPLTYILIGKGLYAGFGIGGYYSGGVFAKDPFYTFRVGLDLPLLDWLRVDVNANYRFENWGDLNDGDTDVGSDTVTLGAAVRLAY